MANKGPATNGSQFFFSYRDKLPHLDAKHTVFGRLLADEDGQLETLDKLEAVPNEPGSDRPMRSIRILQVYVLENPFDDWKENLQRRLARDNVTEAEQKQRQEKKKRKEDDRTTWLGTNLGAKAGQDQADSLSHLKSGREATVGRYLDQRPSAAHSHESTKKQKTAAASSGFGDFSSW